jgi:hypothetical protein
MQNLVAYLLTAMLSWVPLSSHTPYGETESEARTRYESIAADVAAVALDPTEPAVFGGADGRVKTAILQVAIASLETGYQKFVDAGDCNQASYHADRRGNCDGGHAHSLWQIHVFGGGYLLLADGSLGSVLGSTGYAAAHPDEVVRGPQLIADRRTAARVAERIERVSMRQYNSLCAFSGEPCDEGRHPKAALRLARAKDYYARHPFSSSGQEGPLASNP